MSSNKKKYYAVARGRKPGLYKTWQETQEQVKNFNGAKFKGFHDIGDALNYLSENDITVQEHASYEPEKIPKDCVLVYTDGSTIDNPGPGGYGVVMTFGNHRKELSAGYRRTTNNRMELMAVIAALDALKKPSQVRIYSDSKYIVHSISKGWAHNWRRNGWKKKDGHVVENSDLWRRLLHLLEKHKVEFIWVKGHAGKKENERCDELAAHAARGNAHLIDEGFEQEINLSLF